MLSRVAASFYWLSRYIERSDGILRMLKINYASSQDAVREFTWEPVIRIYSGADTELMKQLNNDSRAVLSYMVNGKNNPNSISNMITLARENARSVQEHITRDLWQCLNEYYHCVKDPSLDERLQKDDPISVLDILIKQIMLYYGTAEVSMERGQGRSFMNIGKFLERSIQAIDILDIKFGSVNTNPDLLTDITYWKHLLQSIGGYELYLKTYRDGIEAQNVMELIILNTDFPRSVIYSVNNISRYYERLKKESNLGNYRDIAFQIGKLQSYIQYSSAQSIRQVGLHQFLTQIKQDLYAIGTSLNEHYFANS
ncbi:alpha-E domain-containing protein [Mucilaginibacter sp. PAMB04274]|uniref:alpha-E domain-containing protein n=1 Tax=Mucilaginibacter sp. PAMB04274 TaxID=3138568 RepID=UPI0031F66858